MPVQGTNGAFVRHAGHMCAAHRKFWCEAVEKAQTFPQRPGLALEFYSYYDYEVFKAQIVEAAMKEKQLAAPRPLEDKSAELKLTDAYGEIERLRHELSASQHLMQRTAEMAGAQIENLRREGNQSYGQLCAMNDAWMEVRKKSLNVRGVVVYGRAGDD